MEKTKELLEEENKRLRDALVQIKGHMDDVNALFEGISDLLASEHDEHDTTVHEADVISLLKKYSNLG